MKDAAMAKVITKIEVANVYYLLSTHLISLVMIL
jgi:hypothetical protein